MRDLFAVANLSVYSRPLWGKSPPQFQKSPKKFKINYAKIEFLSISGVIFSPASGASPPDPHRGSAPGPDLPLLFKLHDIWLVDSQENH